MSENGRLSQKQEALLLALVAGQGIEEAARTANISPRTAYRWQKLDTFQEELEEARKQAFEKKLSILRDGVGAALSTLARNMSERAPAGVQVSAARTWLEMAITIYKTEQLEDSLAEVEYLLKSQIGGRYATL